jgi:hypothetical protein
MVIDAAKGFDRFNLYNNGTYNGIGTEGGILPALSCLYKDSGQGALLRNMR